MLAIAWLTSAALVAGHQRFEVELRECRRFPAVLYLAPVPDTGLRVLTEAVAARWPEAPPYAGQFAEVIPHLTVASDQEPEVIDMIEASISGLLPITVSVDAVRLITYTGSRWREEYSFPLLGGGPARPDLP